MKDYCPNCKRVTPHIKDMGYKLCKRCGKQEKAIKFITFKS